MAPLVGPMMYDNAVQADHSKRNVGPVGRLDKVASWHDINVPFLADWAERREAVRHAMTRPDDHVTTLRDVHQDPQARRSYNRSNPSLP